MIRRSPAPGISPAQERHQGPRRAYARNCQRYSPCSASARHRSRLGLRAHRSTCLNGFHIRLVPHQMARPLPGGRCAFRTAPGRAMCIQYLPPFAAPFLECRAARGSSESRTTRTCHWGTRKRSRAIRGARARSSRVGCCRAGHRGGMFRPATASWGARRGGRAVSAALDTGAAGMIRPPGGVPPRAPPPRGRHCPADHLVRRGRAATTAGRTGWPGGSGRRRRWCGWRRPRCRTAATGSWTGPRARPHSGPRRIPGAGQAARTG